VSNNNIRNYPKLTKFIERTNDFRAIQAGLNPRVLREKLLAYAGLHGAPAPAKE